MPLFSSVRIDFPFLQSFENENFLSWLATITGTPACVPKCNQIIIAEHASQYIYSGTHYLTFAHYQARARALRALGLLLADGTPTVGGGKTF